MSCFKHELKETGHTPERTEDDGKEVPVKRQAAANRKPPLQKSRSQESDRPRAISESRYAGTGHAAPQRMNQNFIKPADNEQFKIRIRISFNMPSVCTHTRSFDSHYSRVPHIDGHTVRTMTARLTSKLEIKVTRIEVV